MATTPAKPKKPDTYARVTEAIIGMLERGVGSWDRPWTGGGTLRLPRRVTGEPYRSINIPLLWAAAENGGFDAPTWMTLRQANELGGQVRAGQKGAQVVFAGRVERPITKAGENATRSAGEDELGGHGDEAATRSVPFLRLYTVFNVEQIDGLPEKFVEPQAKPHPINPDGRDPVLDAFVDRTGVRLEHGGNRAFYSPDLDFVRMPRFEHFTTAGRYYGTLFHELTHWTGAEARTGRGFTHSTFGDKAYAAEELIAELGSAFVCATVGIEPIVCEHHAEYLNSWLTVLRSDTKAIFRAAAAAQKAADFLLASWVHEDADQTAALDLETSVVAGEEVASA